MRVNTARAFKRFKEAGMTEEQAEAITYAISDMPVPPPPPGDDTYTPAAMKRLLDAGFEEATANAIIEVARDGSEALAAR